MCGRRAATSVDAAPTPLVRLLSHPSANTPGAIVAEPFEPLIIYCPFDASATISVSGCVSPYGPTMRKGIHRRLALCARNVRGEGESEAKGEGSRGGDTRLNSIDMTRRGGSRSAGSEITPAPR